LITLTKVNDEFGHQVGDSVNRLSKIDEMWLVIDGSIGRWGGEEFLV